MEYDNTNRGMLGRNTNKQSDKRTLVSSYRTICLRYLYLSHIL